MLLRILTVPWLLKLWVSAAWWRVLLSQPDSEHLQVWPCKQMPGTSRETATDTNAQIALGPDKCSQVMWWRRLHEVEAKGAMGHCNGHVISTSALSLVLFPNYINTFYRHSQVEDGVSGVFFCSRNWLEWKQSCLLTKIFLYIHLPRYYTRT